MQLSDFNQRITVQKGVIHPDFYGEDHSFSNFYSCFASVKEKSLAENIKEGNLVQDEILEFVIRDCRKLKELSSDSFQILFQERIYDILTIDHDQFKGRYLRITARRRKTDGHSAV